MHKHVDLVHSPRTYLDLSGIKNITFKFNFHITKTFVYIFFKKYLFKVRFKFEKYRPGIRIGRKASQLRKSESQPRQYC